MNEKHIFKSNCPVLNCSNESLISWKHTNCGNGEETIDINGNVECMNCGKKFFVMDGTFDCGKHDSCSLEADKIKILKALGANVSISENDSEIAFWCKLCKNLKQKISLNN